MGGRLSMTGYNSTLLQLIQERHQMADMYIGASHSVKGEKKDLLLRLSQQERENIHRLESIYKELFCTLPHSATALPIQTSINEMIMLETKSAIHLAHMSKSAPTKQLFILYKTMMQQSIQNGYMLLLL